MKKFSTIRLQGINRLNKLWKKHRNKLVITVDPDRMCADCPLLKEKDRYHCRHTLVNVDWCLSHLSWREKWKYRDGATTQKDYLRFPLAKIEKWKAMAKHKRKFE